MIRIQLQRHRCKGLTNYVNPTFYFAVFALHYLFSLFGK